MSFDADVTSGEVWTEHEPHANTPATVHVANYRHDARTDRSTLRRQMKRHLYVKNAFVVQLAVDHSMIDVLRQIQFTYHRLLEHGALAVV